MTRGIVRDYESHSLIRAIVKRRLALGMSRPRLAELTGISVSTLEKFETGQNNGLAFAKLLSIVDMLGMDLQMVNKSI